jgi:mRNA-degrading endonuclease toxin of MazEF toxin-antitoxin module
MYDVDPGHPIGHEPTLTRSEVVVSADVLNNSTRGLVVVA